MKEPDTVPAGKSLAFIVIEPLKVNHHLCQELFRSQLNLFEIPVPWIPIYLVLPSNISRPELEICMCSLEVLPIWVVAANLPTLLLLVSNTSNPFETNIS